MRATSIARMHGASAALGACLALFGVGCAAKNDPTPVEQGCENRGEPITLGMTKQSDDGNVTATLVEATPVPPLQGLNDWTVDLRTSAGPVLDATDDSDSTVLINIFMADHDHNLTKRGTMTDPGIFEFPPLTITMAGYWEFTVRVEPDQPADDEHEDMLFGFCVPKD